jgi:D-tyrosyl-tRNA(Tyr) deacylase
MRAVVTRVRQASVEIAGKTVGSIDGGFLILLGIKTGDTETEAKKLADKITELRVFEDNAGKMNRSLRDAGGSILVVSQFTLYGNCKHGRRPEFLSAAKPDTAVPLYELFISLCREKGFNVQTGEFGADMQVYSQNDGPVTLILDTENL